MSSLHFVFYGDPFREQPKVRLAIGVIIVVVVWAMYIARVTLGVGLMRDNAGNQSPVEHYLVGALIGTAMVVIWIVVRGMMGRK